MSTTKEKTMLIAFTNGGLIPASVAKTKDGKDKAVDAHKPVAVPYSYGKSLIDDLLAYAPEKKSGTTSASKKGDGAGEGEGNGAPSKEGAGEGQGKQGGGAPTGDGTVV